MANKFIRVEWKDAACDHGWAKSDEVLKRLTVCTHVGILIEETPEHVVIAFGINDVGQFDSCTTIPKTQIIKMRQVK